MTKFALLLSTTLCMTAGLATAGGHASAVDYTVNGKTFQGFIATPEGDAKGSVFIIHDWDGLNDYEKKRAGMLAELGYNAVALDLFGTEAKLEGFEDYRRETGALYQDRTEFRARISAGVQAATEAIGDTGSDFLMGYCFGGAAVLEGARAGLDLDGFVSFHGGLGTPEGQSYADTKAPVLLLHGSADPVSGMGDLATVLNQLQEAGVTHAAEVFGGARHSFTIEGSRDYDADADQKSWAALVRFLGENS